VYDRDVSNLVELRPLGRLSLMKQCLEEDWWSREGSRILTTFETVAAWRRCKETRRKPWDSPEEAETCCTGCPD
jgi:hypothetical protein